MIALLHKHEYATMMEKQRSEAAHIAPGNLKTQAKMKPRERRRKGKKMEARGARARTRKTYAHGHNYILPSEIL